MESVACLWYVWILLLISLLMITLTYSLLVARPKAEPFADFPTKFTTEEAVVYVYRSTLDREPTPSELLRASADIDNNKLTFQALRMRLLQSEEYARGMRVQSNRLVPNLERSIQDKLLLQHVADVYKEEMKATIPADMVLPLRDIFVHFSFNDCTLRALFRHPNYFLYERETQMAPNLTRETNISTLAKRFNVADLEATGKTITKCGVYGGGSSTIGNDLRSGTIVDGVVYGADGTAMAIPPAALSKDKPVYNPNNAYGPNTPPVATNPVRATNPGNPNSANQAPRIAYPENGVAQQPVAAVPQIATPLAPSAEPKGAAAADKVARTIQDKDTDMTALMRQIQLKADAQFDKEQAAQALRTHQGGMVLRPEMAWSVPQPRPPVCLPYGPQAPVEPTIPANEVLIGTPIATATYNTRIGSAVRPPIQA